MFDAPALPAHPSSPLFARLLTSVLLLVGFAAAAFLLIFLDVTYRHRHRILTPDQIDARPVAIVYGAGVYPSGRLSPVLVDRMNTAIELYQAGKVQKLLLTGDNTLAHYNEPARMGDYARQQGLPESALAYDYAGRRTYDSCWRARHIFGLERVVLVTQGFHLPRALYTCDQIGLDAVGVASDKRTYMAAPVWAVREALARVRAWYDTHIIAPQPTGGDPIDIFAPGYDGRVE